MLIDITRPIHSSMVIYPHNPPVSIRAVQRAGVEESGLSEVSFGSHTGTHIDALSHIDPDGWGVEHYTLETYIGSCDVVDVSSVVSVIHASDIPPTTSPRILFKTRNSSVDLHSFDPDFVALAEDAAEELIRRGTQLVGIDALSIKKKGVKDRVHELLLRNSICIVEGLSLGSVAAGTYELMCLPLSIPGIDGAPVRAILRV